MTTKTKILLAISLSAFAISTTGILWGVALPVGAITLGLFMIFKLLDKEAALYDTEQRARIERAQPSLPTPPGAAARAFGGDAAATKPNRAGQALSSAVSH